MDMNLKTFLDIFQQLVERMSLYLVVCNKSLVFMVLINRLVFFLDATH